ncbi:hypothetical protein GCM10008960_07930 [Deinococcus sedimenti]|uniref:Uncharacterized protein n=1 Tax=Deinococcus sedimenti TaxID=1867090 RepID=A0ABQ2S0X4_9DEIO|nr:hypothetical protein GCM10008960_07930 [Deinococcus sedimenti]
MSTTRHVPPIQSAEEFVRLRTSDFPDVQLRATHGGAPVEVWFEVIAEHPDMRFWVAHNRTVPDEVLVLLARDPDPRVRWRVADRRSCPPSVMEELCTDPDEGVRERLSFNARTPRSILERLERDRVARIAKQARKRLSALDTS